MMTINKLFSLLLTSYYHIADHSITYKVNSSATFQTILGFGGAFTDSATINILNVTKPVKENLLKSYFSTDGKISYSIPSITNMDHLL